VCIRAQPQSARAERMKRELEKKTLQSSSLFFPETHIPQS